MLLVVRSRAPILSNAGCSDAAAKTVSIVRDGPTPHDIWTAHTPEVPMQEASTGNAVSATSHLRTRQLDPDIRCLDHRHGWHPGLEVELVDGFAREQRHQPMRTGLDLDLGRHPILDDPGDDAGKAIASRSRDDHVRRLAFRGLRKACEGRSVHQSLAA